MSDSGEDSRKHALSRDALRDAAVGGARWFMGARFVAELATLASSVVLARLIAPAEFGHAAVALLVPILAVSLSYEGFGAILVQRPEVDPIDAQTAESLSIAFGLLSTAVIWVTAPLWAEPLFGERTAELVRFAALAFAVSGFGVVSRARLERKLDFRRLSSFEVAAAMAGYVVSVTAALAGVDAKALIAGALTRNVTETALMCFAEHPPRLRFDPKRARDIVTFGSAASLASLSFVLRRNIDFIILTARIPAAQVGFYWRAYILGAEYQEKLSGIITRLVFPLFSRAATTADTRLLRSRVIRINTFIIFPLLTTLIVVAPVFVPWLYGQRWESAVVPTQILAVGGMFLTIMSGTEGLILALGRPRLLLGFNISFLGAIAAAVWITSSSGLTAVCLAVAGVHVVMVIVAQAIVLRRLIGLRLRELIADVGPAMVASAAASAAGLATATRIEALQSLAQIAILSFVSIGVFLVVYRSCFSSAWAQLSRTFRRVLMPATLQEDAPESR